MLALAHPDVAIAIRTLIALVFLSAAAAKMRNWPIFRGVVANYRLLPQVLVGPVTYALPPAEAAIGAMLPTSLFAPWAEAAAAVLLGAFAVAMGINLLRGRRQIDCGCFRGALVRLPNVAFAIMSDQELTDVLNFMVFRIGGASVPAHTAPYSIAEVARLRKQPLNEVSLVDYRKRLVEMLIGQHGAPQKLRVYGSDRY